MKLFYWKKKKKLKEIKCLSSLTVYIFKWIVGHSYIIHNKRANNIVKHLALLDDYDNIKLLVAICDFNFLYCLQPWINRVIIIIKN